MIMMMEQISGNHMDQRYPRAQWADTNKAVLIFQFTHAKTNLFEG